MTGTTDNWTNGRDCLSVRWNLTACDAELDMDWIHLWIELGWVC